MKIYAVHNGKFNRNSPLASIPLFGYQGGGVGIADNGWFIRDDAGRTDRGGVCRKFDWSIVPKDVTRIAYCTGKGSGKNWDWSYLIRSEADLTLEEAKRWNDRMDGILSKQREVYRSACEVIQIVNDMSESERARFFRIKSKMGWPLKEVLHNLTSHVDITDRDQAQYPINQRCMSEYDMHNVEDIRRGLAVHAKYASEVLPEGVTAPVGKHSVKGEVVSIKYKSSRFGGGYKMLVKLENGTKVYGTAPGGYDAEAAIHRGDEIEFSATFTKSDDPTFGFFSRPKLINISSTQIKENQ